MSRTFRLIADYKNKKTFVRRDTTNGMHWTDYLVWKYQTVDGQQNRFRYFVRNDGVSRYDHGQRRAIERDLIQHIKAGNIDPEDTVWPLPPDTYNPWDYY